VFGLVLTLALSSMSIAASGHPAPVARGNAAADVVRALERSADAFERGDLKAATQVWSNAPSLTVFEGGHINRGWLDYRDNHLGPEMKELHGARYRLSEVVPHVVGDTAWATFAYGISGSEIGGRTFSGSGIGTAVLQRQTGNWRIVHWHTTSTPRPRTPSPTATP
jgi:ketosteroid isomerase-like protein